MIFYKAGELPDNQLRYLIICTLEAGNWLLVRHRERETWELPAGHIETGESPFEAAKRELFEETGSLDYLMEPLFDYGIELPSSLAHGRVYFAEISRRGVLPPSEIAEVKPFRVLPDQLTYAEIQQSIIKKAGELKVGKFPD